MPLFSSLNNYKLLLRAYKESRGERREERVEGRGAEQKGMRPETKKARRRREGEHKGREYRGE
jgi:hypothetical protein